MKHLSAGAVPVTLPSASRWVVGILGCCLVIPAQAFPIAAPPPFSLDMVASNLQRLADQVPDESYPDRLIAPRGCDCAGQDDPYAEEASAEVGDGDFQVAPSSPGDKQEFDAEDKELRPTYALTMLQRSAADHAVAVRQRSGSRTGCKCGSARLPAVNSKALSLATSASAVGVGKEDESTDAKLTGIWVYTCQYAQQDLVFWRLTNTAYLRGGIILKETIAYTDTCKMCDYNNVACNKKEVELRDGNCLCMWRMNGAEMSTMLLSCSACVTDCLGTYKSFDLGKPEPAMQKGICLRKKPHKGFEDLEPIKTP